MIKLAMIEAIKKSFKSKGFKFFEEGLYNLNIFAVRSNSEIVDKFNDSLFCVYKDGFDTWVIREFRVTTDAGKYYLKKPLNSKGTAVLCEGQYLGAYKLDFHNGKYLALCQRLGKVKVYRDNNKDLKIDKEVSTVEEGDFGINIHKSYNSYNIGRNSAGCIVFKRQNDFNEFIELCKKSSKNYGNKFSLTLFEGK